MTPSETMLEALRAYAHLPASKAVVNAYGVSALHARLAAPPQPQGLTDSRVVVLAFPSLYAEHKDLGTLLRALPILNGEEGRRFILRTTADPDDGLDHQTARRKEDLDLSRQPEIARQVEFLDRRDWQQAQELYQRADILVSPSLVESFGYPLVEAMAHGLPVVAADTEVNREICAEAALYFSPRSSEDLARAVRQVAADRVVRERLIAAGKERADRRFRWSRHVARLLETVSARNGNDS
jgi:glycosyltransferase involved in cell wall biosynthesis